MYVVFFNPEFTGGNVSEFIMSLYANVKVFILSYFSNPC